jgi:hypothetical protein
MTPDCDRFELELGMRQHGALDAAEEAALDAHLAGCASCRRFADTGDVFDSTLRRRAAAEAATVDWTHLERGVHQLQRSHRLKLWLAPVFLLQTPLAFLVGTGHLPPPQVLAIAPFATVAIYLAYVWLVNRPFREVLAVVKSSDDLLAGYLRELRRQRLRARIFVVVNSVLSVACIAFGLVEGGVRLSWYMIGCQLLFSLWAVYDARYTLPRLARAIAEVTR